MADKRATPEAPHHLREDAHKGPRRKKRAPPTIDLTAREVESVPPESSPHHAAGEPSHPDPMPESHSGADAGDTNGGKAKVTRSGGLGGAMFAGGMAGAVIAILLMVALWFTGLMPGRNAGSADRIAALESHVRDLQNRPGAGDGKVVTALSERLSKIEQTLANMPAREPAVAERLAAADNAMNSLGVALTALNKRSDDTAGNAAKALERADAAAKAVSELRASTEALKSASAGIAPAELDALQKRIAALEQSAKVALEQIAKASSADNAARLALGAAALREVVRSGAPFAAELKDVQSLGAGEKELAPLAPFAATGVPDDKTLAHDLAALLPAMLKASDAQAPAGGFLERLQANAGKLVRVRPVDAPPGDDASAVLARIEIAAAKADIAGALADLAKLPDGARAPAAGWIDKAEARQAALTAARRLAVDTARALAPQAGAK
jgi:hypothetical protein